ncbi:DUF3618 domain-containing protein [Halomonas sp. SpR1]|uniref:DUF3618 domain-containing protein n=1 Tax=Halomonas sp. SpR1 TaxID=3050462 RepID=UPI0027E44868|nr:DUF3618 domain-containing protein [Halomonas sp. SpR1]MDQ7732980.1 DUF3618 domain-containing protein [Halomonas sp. SpR1]
MTDHANQRSPEEIEKDINQSRERLDTTLNEIEERFSPQQLLNTSYEYLRHGGANEFVANLGTTIKQNPLPFLVTTAGLGWMMLSQRQPNRSQQQYASNLDQRFYTGGQPSSNTSGAHGSPGIPIHEGTHPNAAMHAQPVGGGGTEHSSDSQGRMGEMAHKAKDSAQHLGQKAKQTAQQWGDKAHHLGDNMRDSTSHLQHGTHNNLHNMGQRARRAEGQASDFIQEHPLVAGALGFALGAALGGIFPATKKEDEYMGEYRDRVLHKAAETGQEQMDKAQHSIHEKAESYKGESQQDKDTQTSGTNVSGTNVNAPQDRETGLKDSPTPFGERSGSERPGSENNRSEDKRSEQNSPERHSPGLAGSSTPSGNTQGSGTNRTP